MQRDADPRFRAPRDVRIEVILQIGTDAGRVVYDGDAVLRQLGARPDAGQHQQLRRLARTRGAQHFTLRTHPLPATAPAITPAAPTPPVPDTPDPKTVVSGTRASAPVPLGGTPILQKKN